MKRYWIFACNNYYPNGGMQDFVTSIDSFGEYNGLLNFEVDSFWETKLKELDYVQIFDSQEKCVSQELNTLNPDFIAIQWTPLK